MSTYIELAEKLRLDNRIFEIVQGLHCFCISQLGLKTRLMPKREYNKNEG